MRRHLSRTGLLALALLLGSARPGWCDGPDDRVATVAREILEETTPQPRRELLIKENASQSVELIAALTRDLKPGTKEEYRRIPWIWRVAIAAGKRNESVELRKMLDGVLPGPDAATLDDWRAVVVGGGIINGISQVNDWPGARIASLVADDPSLARRWAHAQELAAAMADDSRIPTGTRYDALRFLGTEAWDRRGAQLFRYLLKGVHAELQMGAVSGLSDVRSDSTAQALLSGMEHYTPGNRELALDALLREERRALALLDALAAHRITAETLGARRADVLRSHPAEAVRSRATRILSR